VRIARAGSVPPSGSAMAVNEVHPCSMVGTTYRSIISGPPEYSTTGGLWPKAPPPAWGKQNRCLHACSRTTTCSKADRPPPPYSFGASRHHRPSSRAAARRPASSSSGIDRARGPMASSTGLIRSATKRDTRSRSMLSSSLSPKPANVMPASLSAGLADRAHRSPR
jgi:hypothetical protein